MQTNILVLLRRSEVSGFRLVLVVVVAEDNHTHIHRSNDNVCRKVFFVCVRAVNWHVFMIFYELIQRG